MGKIGIFPGLVGKHIPVKPEVGWNNELNLSATAQPDNFVHPSV
jgi:hypothetical protein